MTSRILRVVAVAVLLACTVAPGRGAVGDKKKRKAKGRRKPAAAAVVAPGGLIAPLTSVGTAKSQQDFPAMCIGSDGSPIVAYIEYDGKADTVKLAKLTKAALAEAATVSKPGSIHQPCLARDGKGTVWCVWSQRVGQRWDLLARPFKNGKPAGEAIALGDSPGNDVFADAKTDRRGRVWVTWQAFRGGCADIYAKYHDPSAGTWSKAFQVTRHPAGDWEPRLAFGKADEALIVFDSYRRGNYDVYLARVSPAGAVKIAPVMATPRYEARAEAAASPDGETLWVAYEDGVKRWGKDLGSEWRTSGGGLHYDRRVRVVRVDLASGTVTKIADVTPLIPGLVAAVGQVGSGAIDVPEIAVDKTGNPWVFFRYCPQRSRGFWQIAVARYDVSAKTWGQARTLANSAHCLDRRCSVATDRDGRLHVAWPSDGRRNKQAGDSNVYLTRIDTQDGGPSAGELPFDVAGKIAKPTPPPVNTTPERPRGDRHEWTPGGTKYSLYWGDLHRHTDFSNCRTTDDGCIVEHFRYAYDAAGLDYLATTDHTDAGKTYSPYEWWQTQKYADMFQNPGFFIGFYGYEREQRWPYGHRNVIFTERGGPIVYISRKRYEQSQWATPLGPQAGKRPGEITPEQLWKILRKSGMQTVTIGHTPACSMGTDWGVYKQIDSQIENLVEIYQGSRISYEAVGAPQPAVATKSGGFGKFAAGAYQNALKQGHKLGVFASSDHRSTGISFGGVYVKQFTRKGVFEAINARRAIAATDKIYMEFSCNGHLLGEIFTTAEKPVMKISVRGTAPLRAVTVVRNETNLKRFTPKGTPKFDVTFTDPDPVKGENRYYVRVEQTDGNMGWTSPVWATYKP